MRSGSDQTETGSQAVVIAKIRKIREVELKLVEESHLPVQ